MLWGNKNGERILATPGAKAICPSCGEEVISKCGFIKIWHWSHKVSNECNTWYEPESEWHINWKNEFPKECQEVIVKNGVRKLIADVKVNNTVLELQNSPIEYWKIIAREIHYGNMIWLFNGETFAKNLILRNKGDYFSFRWKHPYKSLWSCNKDIFFDMNDDMIFHIKKIHHNVPCGGWGVILSKEEFLEKINGVNK